MAETEVQAPIFSFTGNHLCLDFTNTVENRVDSHDELLHSYSDLVAWSQQAHILTDDEAQRLEQEGARRSGEVEDVYRRAIELRETLYRIFFAVAKGSEPARDDLRMFNEALSQAMAQVCVVPKEGSFAWDWLNKGQALDRMLWVVLRSAADLLISGELDTVRVCAADDCNWLFLDTSKNHSRRWCDMKSCGNRAKVRKHYKQKKQAV